MDNDDLAIDWNNARNRPRGLHDNVVILGAGSRRVQLIYAPSFEQGYSWDLRELDKEFRIYRSDIKLVNGERKALGYSELQANSNALKLFVYELESTELSLTPDHSGRGGFDGTSFQIALFGDLSSAVRFQWWGKGPSQWQELIEIAREMIDLFLQLEPMPVQAET